MQNAPDITTIMTYAEDEVLSPESYVFVALMSMEEGPNKASFLQFFQPLVSALEALDTAL